MAEIWYSDSTKWVSLIFGKTFFLPQIFRTRNLQKCKILRNFDFKARFLKMRKNRKNSITGNPIGLIFGYVSHMGCKKNPMQGFLDFFIFRRFFAIFTPKNPKMPQNWPFCVNISGKNKKIKKSFFYTP